MDSQLRKIATASRREMESFAREHVNVGHKGSDVDLGCYCAIASYFLVMMGRRFGYNLTLIEGSAFEGPPSDLYEDEDDYLGSDDPNHCWVEYKGMIIDLSAMQFDSSLKKVHVTDIGDEEYWPLRRNNAARKSMKDWPDTQTPYSYIKELRKRANKLSIKIAA